jgi:hypothetical protein
MHRGQPHWLVILGEEDVLAVAVRTVGVWVQHAVNVHQKERPCDLVIHRCQDRRGSPARVFTNVPSALQDVTRGMDAMDA